MKQAGFENLDFVGKTGFSSSPVTTGALFRAVKKLKGMGKSMRNTLASMAETKSAEMHVLDARDTPAEQPDGKD